VINPQHTDIYLPVPAEEKRLVEAIDGQRSIVAPSAAAAETQAVRSLFERLWQYDQIVFDTLYARG